MSIYIISNREVYQENGIERFKDKGKEHALPKFRVATCKIDGQNINYSILNNQYPTDYEEVVSEINSAGNGNNLRGSSSMFFNLYQSMFGEGKRADTLVFIHGFANSFQSNLEHIKKLSELFIENPKSPIENLLYIAWPTRNHKVLTYWDDQKDAIETGRVLARVYDKLFDLFVEMFSKNQVEPCGSKIHLAAHSMGNQVLKGMLENIPTRKLKAFFGEVMLFHSDVENTVFEEGEPFTKLERLADRTHMYIHNSDDALWISRWTKNFNKRLGKYGPKNRRVLNDETFIVDVTKDISPASFRERVVDHWGYIESKKEINDIIEVFIGTPADSIQGRVPKKEETAYYYI